MARDLVLQVIEQTRGDALAKTAREADRAGDSIGKLGAAMRKAGKDSDDLDANLGKLGAKAAGGIAGGVLSGFGEVAQGLKGALMPIAAVVGVGLAPAIGAAIGTAVAGGVGAGGVIGGVVLAARDPAVKGAFKSLGSDMLADLERGAAGFKKPLMSAATEFGEAWSEALGPSIAKAFGNLDDAMPSLSKGLAGFGRELAPGLEALSNAAVPVLEALGDSLPGLGASITKFGQHLEAAGPGLEAFTTDIMKTTGASLEAIGVFTRLGAAVSDWTSLSKFGEESRVFGENMRVALGMSEPIIGVGAKVADSFADVAHSAGLAAIGTSKYSTSIGALQDALNDLFDDQMSVDQAVQRTAENTLALKEAVEDHGTSLSKNTEAGLSNRGMLLTLIDGYETERDAAIKAGKSTGVATAKFDDQVTALFKLGEKLGFSRSELKKILGPYMDLHNAPDIRKSITINYGTTGSAGPLPGNIMVPSFDSGGPVPGPAGTPRLAVVHGGEYVLSREMLSGRAPSPASPAAVRTAPIQISGHGLGVAVMRWLQDEVRTQYGGDVVAAFGP